MYIVHCADHVPFLMSLFLTSLVEQWFMSWFLSYPKLPGCVTSLNVVT